MSTRIKGAALALSFGGTDYWADATSVTLENEEASSDVTTFADAAAGGARQFFFNVSAIQSTAAGSFWRYVWDNTGNSVAFRYAPHGNATATADQPHYLGTAKVGPKPTLGGEAGANTTFTFEVRFDVEGVPTPDYGASAAAAITSITPEGQSAGDTVLIAGTRFTDASDVKFATNSAEFTLVSDTVIVAVVPTGTGVKAVTVVTPEGTSASVSYTVV